jgi:prepilin-type N-terminal cleavage/methylation domain-containing protein
MRRNAFTLVELLVVIAIIGILVAMLLPAVQSAREAARRMQCSNNLKQLGLALHNYHTAHNTFPPGSLAYDGDNRATSNHKAIHNWPMFIAPQMEQQNLADKYNWNVGFRGPDYGNVNGEVFRLRLPFMQCPSDSPGVFNGEPGGLPTGNFSRSNYVACHSPNGSLMEKGVTNFDKTCVDANNPATKKAVFNWNVVRRIDDIRDGTSNTVALSEVIAGPNNTPDLRGAWWTDLGMGYTHLRSPNSSVPDQMLGAPYCNSAKAPCTSTSPCWSTMIIAARSNHSGGVVSCLADGSVHFFSSSIDAQLWIDLASYNGGEVVTVN